ncbi:MAG: glycine cleavage system aminomethyltransferase GcvT [Planctomycetota bacterium]|nr:glycine cleavage system aminomethyltransferase GcvT [Planctomycetota bacterium]
MSEPSSELQRTVLHGAHRAAGASLVDFHGWEMPVRYGSIPGEHQKVRSSAGLFDLCHMGRLELRGPGAAAWLERVLSGDVARMAAGRARYRLILNERGTIIDDVIVYRLPDEWLLVVNASNRRRVMDWLQEHRPPGSAAELIDRTADWAMIALQGPRSREILRSLVTEPETPWDALRYYRITAAQFDGVPVRVARTGYTGEDGFEVYLPADRAEALWNRALEVGGDRVAPIGLGARDTLRLEAGMPLYGQEIDETTDPFEAGLGFAVKLDKEADFVGRDSLLKMREAPPRRRLRGLRIDSRRVARHGMKIFLGGRQNEVGYITSGAPSPTLGYPIAMGYLERHAETAGDLRVDVRGRREPLQVVDLPFVSRTRKK